MKILWHDSHSTLFLQVVLEFPKLGDGPCHLHQVL
ncbi:unnamed protein product [Chondrus crispus]|uniref:Uncharacterized protein n=1 Tax=Chondrus crispus TaxID=2769 RepID=R7QNA3_CHOCR|nr:unnamed protein product [Chondrus crispus]CDF38870.1 unnamed protein product [Chondrus crispus]|eukprot:XP_005718775.1 unnamed protein product [Chondrus crispus]